MTRGRGRGWPRSVAEFEVWHARQPDRREFIGGRPCLMAPRSLRHTVIKGNAFSRPRGLDDPPLTLALADLYEETDLAG